MKTALTITLFVATALVIPSSNAQPAVQAGYSYLHANNWDRIIQTYNFSRPWKEEAVAPWTGGSDIRGAYTFLFSKWGEIRMSPSLGWRHWRSISGTRDHGDGLFLHEYSVALPLYFSPKALFREYQTGPLGPRWFVVFSGSYSAWTAVLRANGVRLTQEDGSVYHPLQFAYSLGVGTGYHFLSAGRWIISPEISMQWSPYAELDEFAETLNGTNITHMNNEASPLLVFNAGLKFHWTAKDKSFWNSP